MITGANRVKRAAGVLGCAAGLLIVLSGPAVAGFWSSLLQGGRTAGRDELPAAARVDAAAEISAKCGECHSSCESGRIHDGRVPALPAGSGLPVTADGRTTCLTCHAEHRKGAAVAGASLRMPNQQRELCLACHPHDSPDHTRVEVVSPLERAIVQERRVALIGRVERMAAAQLAVRVNGGEFHLQVKDGAFSTWLTLHEGVNRIEIAQEGRLLWSGEFYRTESATTHSDRTSSGHRTGSREQCRECHQRSGEQRADLADAGPGLCFGCHERNDEKRYVHGPLAVGACLACHDPHGGYGRAHLRREQGELCGNCHAAGESPATAACRSSEKGCVDCHDPHQSDVKYLLRPPQYTLRDIRGEARP